VEQCQTDRELMELAIVSQHGNGQDWLWSYIQEGVRSPVPLQKSYSMTLLAFIEGEEARTLLNTLLEDQPDTWVKQLLETSLRRCQMNAWAKHWFRRFLCADDDVTAWASFRLFLQCVDSRFWLWQRQIKNEVTSSANIERRWTFLEDNLDTLKNMIRKNEEPLEKHFLGQKILQNQVWPWM
jgi:hypothetical protein